MKKGFTLTVGRKMLFQESENKNICKAVVEKFIDKIGEIRGFDPAFIERCKHDEATLKDLKYRIAAGVTLEGKETNGEKWYSISSKYFGGGYDPHEIVIF